MLWRKSCTFGKPVRDILGLDPEWKKDLNQPTDLVREAFKSWWQEKATDGINLIAESLNCHNQESTMPAAPSGNVFPSDFSTEFFTLKHEAYSRADPHDADRGGCLGAFNAKHYDTKVTWSKLKWLNKKLLQIDASDTSFATTVSGSGSFQESGVTVASAIDCAENGSERGEGVIDLRGTPYMIANVGALDVKVNECYKQCSGSCQSSGAGSAVCSQWIAFGTNAAMRVTCWDNNQRCVVRCGGSKGGCRPRNNMLQLALAPIDLADFVPADDETVGVWKQYSPDDSGARRVFFKPYPNNGESRSTGNGEGASAFPITITAPQSGIYQVRLSQMSGGRFRSFTGCRSGQRWKDDSFFICSSDPRSSAENPGPKNPNPGTSDLSSCSTYNRSSTSSSSEGVSNKFGNAQMHTFQLYEGTNTLWLTSNEVCALAEQIMISLPSRVVALADYAPAGDATVGVRTGDGGAREVFFKPVPNDGTTSSLENGNGASAFEITVMVPQSGKYQVGLTQRRGSDAFEDKAGSACRSSALSDRYASGKTDSFLICLLDPRSTATNPDPGTPDLSSCEEYHYGHSPKTFSFSDGANSLWLASRELCALASEIMISLESLVIALADYAPASDDTVGLLPGDDGAREVFFKPVPNDGTTSHLGGKQGESAIQISVMVPQSGNYQVRLTQRRGIDEFKDEDGSACRSSKMERQTTDSFFICSSDPRSTATNPYPTPDLSSCTAFTFDASSHTFSFSEGANSLWLASREVCSLASEITITAV